MKFYYIVCNKSGQQGTWSAKCPRLVHCRMVHWSAWFGLQIIPNPTLVSATIDKISKEVTEGEPRGYKTFFMPNSAEHEIFPANKIQITNICNVFLA